MSNKNKFTLTTLAAYVKNHFHADPEWNQLDFIDGVRKAIAIEFGHNEFTIRDIATLLVNRVENIDEYGFRLSTITSHLRPSETWKSGYRHKQGRGYIRRTKEQIDALPDYDFDVAVIHVICSGLSCLTTDYFLPELVESYNKR